MGKNFFPFAFEVSEYTYKLSTIIDKETSFPVYTPLCQYPSVKGSTLKGKKLE